MSCDYAFSINSSQKEIGEDKFQYESSTLEENTALYRVSNIDI